jgi:hypothetical protein
MPWTTPETFTAGQTLTAASMNVVSGDLSHLYSRDALVLINATTLTAASAATLDSVFTSAYENYLIMLRCQTTLGGGTFDFRFRAGGVTTTSGYNFTRMAWAATYSQSKTTAQATVRIGANDASGYHAITVMCMAPQLAQPSFFHSMCNRNAAAGEIEEVWAAQSANTQHDGFTLSTSNGAMTGAVQVYGYASVVAS